MEARTSGRAWWVRLGCFWPGKARDQTVRASRVSQYCQGRVAWMRWRAWVRMGRSKSAPHAQTAGAFWSFTQSEKEERAAQRVGPLGRGVERRWWNLAVSGQMVRPQAAESKRSMWVWKVSWMVPVLMSKVAAAISRMAEPGVVPVVSRSKRMGCMVGKGDWGFGIGRLGDYFGRWWRR